MWDRSKNSDGAMFTPSSHLTKPPGSGWRSPALTVDFQMTDQFTWRTWSTLEGALTLWC